MESDGAGDADVLDFPLPANARPAPAPAAMAAITSHFLWLCDLLVTGAVFVTETLGSGLSGGAAGVIGCTVAGAAVASCATGTGAGFWSCAVAQALSPACPQFTLAAVKIRSTRIPACAVPFTAVIRMATTPGVSPHFRFAICARPEWSVYATAA